MSKIYVSSKENQAKLQETQLVVESTEPTENIVEIHDDSSEDAVVVSREETKAVVEEKELVVQPSEHQTEVIEVGILGLQGAKGKSGDSLQSPTYVHEQQTPSEVWEINHGQEKYPAVAVVDSSGRWVIGDVEYFDDNTLKVYFTAPFSGAAYLN